MSFISLFQNYNLQKKYTKRKRVRLQQWILEVLSSIGEGDFEVSLSEEKVHSFFYKGELAINLIDQIDGRKYIEFFYEEQIFHRFIVEGDLSFTKHNGDYYSTQSLFEDGDYNTFTMRFVSLFELAYTPALRGLGEPLDIFRIEKPMLRILLAFNEIRKGRYSFNLDFFMHEEFVYTTNQEVQIKYVPKSWTDKTQWFRVYENGKEVLAVFMDKKGHIERIKDDLGYLNSRSLYYFKVSLDRFLRDRKTKESSETKLILDKEQIQEEVVKKMNAIDGGKSAFRLADKATSIENTNLSKLAIRVSNQDAKQYLKQFTVLFLEMDKEMGMNRLDIETEHEYERMKNTRLPALVQAYIDLKEEEQGQRLHVFIATLNSMMEDIKGIQAKIKNRRIYAFEKQIELNRWT